ncbi:helix-turn-helix transcriptional regulator [Croceicoccus mobilis]|uniref:Transcriptional regulator n=1 Tax=Croceicoccus mobilis TaxID=1703339 RepID=A0A916Z704_9SPHN|nr:helix-turn-helix transcriptional regulator [Croceicoccus mobilis]GGD79132.1 transcriptional regulator [Croceicoccus mobilis]
MPKIVIDRLDDVTIVKAEDIRPAARALAEIAEAYGMRVAPAHDIADKRTPVDADGNILASEIFGWPDSEKVWWRIPRIALESPITSACRYETEPFWINGEGFHQRVPNPFLDAIDLNNFESRARTRAAIVVPVHMAFGKIGAVSYNPIDAECTDLSETFEKHGDELGIYARAFIASYTRIMGEMQSLPPGSRLSKREVECLRWAAIGKTDMEISMIMSRSRATVRFHIHNASTKLDAVNRSQTVFKAAQLGYLSVN